MNSEPLSESMPRIGKGKTPGVLDRLGDPDRRLVRHRAVHRPARRDVGHGEGEAELPEGVPALVADEVDLDEARAGLVPLRPGADRDLGLEQRAGLGVAATHGTARGPWRRRSRRSIVAGLICISSCRLGVAEIELAVTAQQRHEDREHRRQALAGRRPGDPPAQLEGRDHPGGVDRRARRPLSHDPDLTGLAQPGSAWSRCQPVSSTSWSRMPSSRPSSPPIAAPPSWS